MMERRIMKLELGFNDHDRRLNDHNDKLIAILDWKAAIEESTEVNRKMVEVGENILLALSWVSVGAKWITAVGSACAILWVTIKAFLALGGR